MCQTPRKMSTSGVKNEVSGYNPECVKPVQNI